MTEIVVLETPSVFRWPGVRPRRTILSATRGSLRLTTFRMEFAGSRKREVIPLERLIGCELNGRSGYLTVSWMDGADRPAYRTFGSRSGGMPGSAAWVQALSWIPASTGTSGDHPRDLSARGALREFAETGRSPHLVSWRVQATVPPEVVPPHLGRIEVWRDVVSGSPLVYPALVVAFRPAGDILAIVCAQLMPSAHDRCHLTVFFGGAYHNLGIHDEFREPEAFETPGTEVALGLLDGLARAEELAPDA